MIEDKKLGLKIAENKEEALWEKFRKAREMSIQQLEDNLTIERELLKLGERKLEEIKECQKKSKKN